MTPEMQKFIDLLESQLGYAEKGDAYTKFGDWYGKNVEFDADYSSAPWCDMYLSWAAHKLGYQDWIGQFAWTVAHAEWFKEQDAWGVKPKPGAFVFYDWSGSNNVDDIDHVGIVTRVEGDTIFTIEGNIDGGVAKRKERDTSKVVGYGYPEQIKARLDEQIALKEAAKQEAEEAKADKESDQATDTEVGQVQQPVPAPTPDLRSFIPESGSGEEQQGPVVAKTAKPRQESAAPAPAATKKGKHAKPATADTQALTTTGPLPVLTNASAPATTSSLGSPALIGTALVAALAVLAVAKTRQLRVRLAPAASAPAPRPARRRRKPRRTALTPVEPLAKATVAPVSDAPLDLTMTTPLDLSAATLEREAREAAAALQSADATAAFDAFAPRLKPTTDETFDAMVAGVRESFEAVEQDVLEERAYRGRRRLHEPAEPAAYADTQPRGRRHRATHHHQDQRPTAHRSPTRTHDQSPAFTQDAPLRGRRHRSDAATASPPADQPPATRRQTTTLQHDQPSHPNDQPRPKDRRSRGRHRA